MYINYINDRKSLGYKSLIDIQCGSQLVLITDSSVVFGKNVILNGKRYMQFISLIRGYILYLWPNIDEDSI